MNERGKTIDKTYLSLDNAEERGFIHRDYIAHCLRWSHVVKRLGERKLYQSARILDIGCGRELPLARLLYSSRYIPQSYHGVDVGPIEDAALDVFASGKFPIKIFDQTDVCSIEVSDLGITGQEQSEVKLPNIVTCFEVLEHVEPEHMMRILEKMKELTTDDARFFISTPCWNRTDCAANHVNEMLYEALGAAFERHGFVVEHVYGTFASIRDYDHLLGDAFNCRNGDGTGCGDVKSLRHVFNQLREYYDTNFLSCVFAPLFPAQSRNALWELSKGNKMSFKPIEAIQKPWSSSSKWEDMAK